MEDEWLVAESKQKPVYRQNHRETCESLVALSPPSSKPNEIFLVEDEEEPCILEPENTRRGNKGEGLGSEEEEVSDEDDVQQQGSPQMVELDTSMVSGNCKSLRWRVVQQAGGGKVLAGEGPPIMVLQKGYQCEDCGKVFSCSSHYSKHRRTHTGERPFRCGDCGKSFNVSSNLYRHQRAHANAGANPVAPTPSLLPSRGLPYQCAECGRCFRRNTELVTHQRLHTGRLPFHFSTTLHFDEHQRTHRGRKPYKCTLCGKAFADGLALVKHQRLHLIGGDQSHQCSECGQSFGGRSQLARHRRLHGTADKPYGCGECGQSFGSRGQLAQHRRLHISADKPYHCGECGLSFTWSSHWERHRRIHTGERPYSCGDCGKRFGRTSHLYRHQRTHAGGQPHICPDCGKSFNSTLHFQRHQHTHHLDPDHTPLPAHACGDCGMPFADASALLKHQCLQAGEGPYPCPQCGRHLHGSSHFYRHLQSHAHQAGETMLLPVSTQCKENEPC
ncbi:hypothetical protein JRQ81_003348 [Phrynocephalus forsythii]|uniref:Zinc finger protein 436-like n=1 Tax=Phrynocephalus forsythii TaxID=171643 RepID=A0A9Q0XKE6_9SAUR|nr:hypothetical protein JRQ81_003348 [Phrynocephalus forsythii]